MIEMPEKIIDAVGCIILKDKKILLGKRFDDEDCYAGVWDLPSGHVENLSPADTMKKELNEELNIKVKRLRQLGSFLDVDDTSKKRFRHIFFIADEWEGEPVNKGELERIGWFKLEEAEKLNIPKADIEFIKNIMKNQKRR